MLPQGMFSVAVATVLFPAISRLAARGDMDGFRNTVAWACARSPSCSCRRASPPPCWPSRSCDCSTSGASSRRTRRPSSPPRSPRSRRARVQRDDADAQPGVLRLQSPWIPTWVAAGNLALNALLYIGALPRRHLGDPARHLVVQRRGGAALARVAASAARRAGAGGDRTRRRADHAGLGGSGRCRLRRVVAARRRPRGTSSSAQLVAVTLALVAGGAAYLGACCLLRVRELRPLLALRRGRQRRAEPMDQSRIRNFSIIAHIDHGKSTLADRILELTETVTGREMREQLLDSMELERERGITIKAQAVRVAVEGPSAQPHRHARPRRLHLRGLALAAGVRGRAARRRRRAGQSRRRRWRTPTSRSRTTSRSCPVVNKIDLPQARSGRGGRRGGRAGRRRRPSDVLRISAKTGEGVADVLDAIVERVPPPAGDPDAPPRALIFDSSYDQYRGVVAFVRVVDGTFSKRARRCARWRRAREFEAEELGFFSPAMRVDADALARARSATSSPA